MPLQTKKEQRFSLRVIIIFIVTFSTLISLIASGLLIKNYVIKQELKRTKDKISSVARITASQGEVIESLEHKTAEINIQEISLAIAKAANVDFVVVLDKELIRLSHPDADVIGQPFSNIPDAKRALEGESHFSTEDGVLGKGTRFFEPIKNKSGEIIGVVCIGLISKTIDTDISDAQSKLIYGLLLGLGVGVIGATYGAYRIKKILFNLEPYEIANLLYDKEVVENEITECILAINLEREVILLNKEASLLLKKIDSSFEIELNKKIPDEIFETLFNATFEKREKSKDQTITLGDIEIIANMSPIFSNEIFSGGVVTFRNQSELTHLVQQLSGTEQYIDSLRAQTHEFMNKMQVIMGMIELKQYDQVTSYMQDLHKNYQSDVGYITDKIKSPAIAGYLLGKVNEAEEKNINFTIMPESYLPELKTDTDIHDLLQILGNILTNAFDAVTLKNDKQVFLLIKHEEEGQIIMLDVMDSGTGISEEIKHQIYDNRFSTKTHDRGYGLYLVKKIVVARKGIIEFSAVEDGGTHFYVEFPMIGEENDHTNY
ncbi:MULTISPECIES: ATP-binding protein [Vagococcus]|uniref:histidine kinase n=1 Tax=Vagococcus fluvialis bH819 TaxID=1255619 RepID=A0A1X6WLA7_9ENTE|nr:MULTISPECIES: ATP-binding protein [Vagococcus]SLM85104.1 Two-component sensor histidine kinase, malate [Vagococcus fluvialis bH819]